MANLEPSAVLSWTLVVFFLLGGVGNLIGPAPVVEGFARWGYPPWFRWVAGVSEIAVAVLLALTPTRTAGALLGGAIMLVAALTVLRHREWLHAIPPLVVLVLSGILLTW